MSVKQAQANFKEIIKILRVEVSKELSFHQGLWEGVDALNKLIPSCQTNPSCCPFKRRPNHAN